MSEPQYQIQESELQIHKLKNSRNKNTEYQKTNCTFQIVQLVFAANAIILIKQAFLDVATKGVRTAQTHYNELQEAVVNSECGKL